MVGSLVAVHLDLPILVNRDESSDASNGHAGPTAMDESDDNADKEDEDDNDEEDEDAQLGDTCYVCEDGGDLIICDKCENDCHLHCAEPPLTEVGTLP